MFITLTPNPALDRLLTLDHAVRPQTLHRVTGVQEQAGGKGVNVSRILRTLGAEVLNAAVLGGFNGQKFAYLLEQEGLPSCTELARCGETRECQILLDGTPQPTEINEAGMPYDAQAMQNLLAKLPAGQMVISGSLPPQMDWPAFAELVRRCAPVAVDTSGPALRVALNEQVRLVKPNLSELRDLTGQANLDTARSLYQRYGTSLLITRGSEGAWLVGAGCWEASVPCLNVSNPVGAGDSTLAGFLWAQEQGLAPQDCLRWAVAAGSASAGRGGPPYVRRSDIEALYAAIDIHETF